MIAAAKKNGLEGTLLVASRRLRDPERMRTAVLVVHHCQSCALGVILNGPLVLVPPQLVEMFPGELGTSNLPIGYGGPKPTRLLAIHGGSSWADIELRPGLYATTGTRQLKRLLARQTGPCRWFVGYVEWKPSQLRKELLRGDWLIAPARSTYILHQHDDLWSQVLKQAARGAVTSRAVGEPTRPASRPNSEFTSGTGDALDSND